MSGVRVLHLGVDYGTAWSKLVLRDLASPRGDEAFVLKPDPPVTLASGTFRIPSLVASDGGRLWFAGTAQWRSDQPGYSAYPSLKIRAALLPCYALEERTPQGLSELDVATLYVGFLLAIGRRAAKEYERSQRSDPVRLGFTLGVPATLVDTPALRERFAAMARRAYLLKVDLDEWVALGLGVTAARELLQDADRLDREKCLQDRLWEEPSRWIRNEAVAALHWGFRSPRIESGLYSAIDVGAGTTNAAWFRILDRRVNGVMEKSGYAFFGSACRTPGVDRIDQEIFRVLANEKGPLEYRDRETEVLKMIPRDSREGIRRAMTEIFEAPCLAFQRAYCKEKRQGAWESCRLLLFGGGSKIRQLRPVLRRAQSRNGWPRPESVDPGLPKDLKDWSGQALGGDHDLLLVAYGLSIPPGDVPEITESSEVDDYSPMSAPASRDLDARLWYLDAG